VPDNQRSVLVRGKASIRRGSAALSGKAPRNMRFPNLPFNLTEFPFEPSGSPIQLVSAETQPRTAKSARWAGGRTQQSRAEFSLRSESDRLRGSTLILLRAAPEPHVQTARGSAPFVRSRRSHPNRNRRAGQLERSRGCCRDGRKAQGL
jgi:hypothetical protein